MGMKAIEYVATFELRQSHTIELRRIPGWLRDTLEVTIDHQNVLVTQVDFHHFRKQTRALVIDEEQVELAWKWGMFFGDPKYILLKTAKRLLAAYGQDRTLSKLPLLVGTSRADAEKMAALRLVKDTVDNERVDDVLSQQFPLNNRFGTSDLAVKQEVSCTVTETITLTTQEEVHASLKGNIVTVLQSQITAQLSKTTGEEIGKSLTRTQTIELAVKAGEAVVYTVIWKVRARVGTFLVAIDNIQTPVTYEAKFGLSFEIVSSPFETEPALENVKRLRGAA